MTRRKLAKTIAPMLLRGQDKARLVRRLAAYLVIEGRVNELDLLVNDIAYELEVLGYSDVQVVSAHELTDNIRTELSEIIKARVGAKEVSLDETVDKSLVGGLVATTPSTEIDLSIRTKLNALGK